MIIYKDIVSGDELLSDAYNVKLVDDVVYEADCHHIKVGNEDVDIGANPSAEGEDEQTDDNTQTVIDVVYSFRLQETAFDKKSYLTHLKGYFKKLKQRKIDAGASEEEVKDFETKAGAFAKKVVSKFGDWDCYVGESMDPDAMVVLMNYREDGVTPYVVIWKDGVTEDKI